MPETTEPTRQYDADMGEVTTQDPDGTVLSVEGCSPPTAPHPWHFNSDALQLGNVNIGPCVRVTKWTCDGAFAVTCYPADETKGFTAETRHLSEAIGIAEAWWVRQGA